MKNCIEIVILKALLILIPVSTSGQSIYGKYEMEYVSYWGEMSQINIRGLGVDKKGYLYIGGRCLSPSSDTWDKRYKNGIPSLDVFVTKFDANNGKDKYFRIIGGSDEDHLKAMDVDDFGNVYLSGRSNSYDFPVTENAFNTKRSGTYDVISVKLNPEGGVVYSAIFGARPMDECRGVGCNNNGYSVYVGGTHGNEYPTTPGPFSKYHGPEEMDPGLLVYKQSMYRSEDCFITMVSPDGSKMKFSHLFGGNGYEKGWAADMDDEGNCYVAGYTTAKDLAVTTSAFSKQNNGIRDAFIAKFSPKGELLASTYLGGSDDEGAYGVAVDKEGRIWVAGKTTSWDFPLKHNFFKKVSPGQDVFIACLSPDLSKLEFATYVGGSGYEEVPSDGLCITEDQRVVLVGKTDSTDFFTKGVAQNISEERQDTDVFCVVINAKTFECELSTRLGGSGNDEPGAVAAGEKEFWIAGSTDSVDFPLSPNAVKQDGSAFIVKYTLNDQ
jgi:hypothetical protein